MSLLQKLWHYHRNWRLTQLAKVHA